MTARAATLAFLATVLLALAMLAPALLADAFGQLGAMGGAR